MVLAGNTLLHPVYTRHIFQMQTDLLTIMLRIISRNISSIFMQNVERERELLISVLTW